MSWAEEDWTVGLSGRVQQKVKELQIHKERLSRENKQKQLQLDNIQTSLEKQTVKFEEVRGELQSVQRELQSVREEAKAAFTSRERLNQELHTRQAQVCSLEGQLDAARSLNNKLTQEVKRLEAELEKLQNNSRLADTTLFSTPSWNTTSPWDHNAGSRQEERSRQRDDGQGREHHSRRLQFSDTSTASLPQHKSTPHRHPSDQSDTFSTPLAAFPWERDHSRPASRRRIPPSAEIPSPDVINQGPLEKGGSGMEKDHKTEANTAAAASSELRSRLSALEDEFSQKVGMLKSVQNEMVQTKKEVAAKELSLQRARDELTLAHTRMAQDSERASGAEQKLKQLQEELKCQRQNTESSRLQHQQRTKELEKQHQRDLTELQKERQCLEKQHQQEVNKLNQELQQARTLHNALQAQADKKQALEKDLDSLKEKLKWTEEQLKESQKKEAQTQAKLTEALHEAEGVAVILEQSRKRERALEEERRRLLEEQADTLCLLKELQAEKCAPAPLQQPVQFCSVGQTFLPHSSFTSSQPPSHSKRPSATQAEQRRDEEDVDERKPEITPSYPSEREPGEGIDTEHISVITNSESLQRMGQIRRSKEQSHKCRNEAIESDIPCMPITNFMDGDAPIPSEHSTLTQNLMLSGEKTPALKSEHTISLEDLKRENALLRSEIYDVRDELQRRLEDLEAQRRAEIEAKTRLKQLSRKHASQAVEREEKDKEWKAQLENEKTETERLRKTIAALEAEMRRGKEEKDDEEEDKKHKAQDDREIEMIELNIQLKKQLAQVKAQLAVEQEERKREEEERNQIMATDGDIKKQLSKKLAEIKAEVEDLKHKRKDSQEESKLLSLNSPLTYLTLHDDELNSNVVSCDTELLTSPEQHHLFCQSTNQLNMLMSTATEDIIQKSRKVIGFEQSSLLDEALTPRMVSEDDTKQNYQERSSSSALERGDHATSDLAKEVERLQREYTKETERANQYQAKLEALQNQVTCQTQQLTMAFEKQSQHISGLLAELQEKESALFSQEKELLCSKQELDALKIENNKEIKITIRDEMSAETLEHKLEQERECVVTFQTVSSPTDDDLNAHHPNVETCDAETPTSTGSEDNSDVSWSGEHHPSSVDSNWSQRYSDSTCEVTENLCDQNGGKTDLVTELLALRQENQLLKQRIEGVTVSFTKTSTLQTENKNPDNLVKQSQNTTIAALSCLAEQETLTRTNDVTTVGEESLQKNVKRSKDECQDLESGDGKSMSEKDLAEVSEVQVNYLQQQVEALQRKVRSLSEETQQQAQELTVWRLASQPASTFDHLLSNTDEECETLDQISVVCQSLSKQQPTQRQAQTMTLQTQVQPPMQGTQNSQDNITVIREDELSLCCSSNKLQGRMLYSRLQSRSLPEQKNIHSFKKTSALQEPAKDQEASLQWSDGCPAQHKVKMDTDFIQMSSQKMAEQIAKDPYRASGSNSTKVVECYTEKPEATSDLSTDTNEINTSDSTDKDAMIEMKSVSSQTEDDLYHPGAPTVCATTQTEEKEEDEDESIDSPPVSLAERVVSDDKMLFSGSFPIPADPARLAERIRRNRTQLSAAFDDTEYEPYGLPEVVMKGFADIPTGPSCPYIVRRGLLGTAVVPMSQKDSQKQEETD